MMKIASPRLAICAAQYETDADGRQPRGEGTQHPRRIFMLAAEGSRCTFD
jgi:hypothetical protein